MVFRFETFGAVFSTQIPCNSVQSSIFRTKFWASITWYVLFFYYIRNLFLFILTFEAAFWRFWTYITRISQTVSKKARQFGSCCHASGNSGVVNKSPVIVLTKVNIKIKMDQAKFLLKSSCTKWISFKSWF